MDTAAVGGFGRLQLRQCVTLGSALTSGQIPPNHAQGCMQTAGTCVFSKRTRRLAKLERNRDARWLELVQPHTTQQRCKAKTAETKTPMLHTDANKPCAAGPGHPVIGNEKPVPCSPTPSGLKCCILLYPPLRSNEEEKKSFFVSPPLPSLLREFACFLLPFPPPPFPCVCV